MSLNTRFLLLVLPCMLAVSLLFLGVLAYNEWRYTERIQRDAAVQSAERIALLLRDPLWDFNLDLVELILGSAIDDQDTYCARLLNTAQSKPQMEKGSCSELEPRAEWVQAPVEMTDREEVDDLGVVQLAVRVQQDWRSLVRELEYLGLLTLILFVTLCLVAGFAFRTTITRPLSRVGESIRHYRATGERLPVDWDTRDELGQFIREYNAGQQHQQETEQAERESRHQAEQALRELEQAQQSLIQAEKLASLGSMVAGIAHEINTPVGNGLTVATSLSERTRDFEAELAEGALRRSSLQNFVDSVDEATRILVNSLHMAAEQVQNFKQVAVDQSSSQRRQFNLLQVVEDVVYTLRPKIKHTWHQVEIAIPEDITMDSFPGPLGQVVTNCINNALFHGYEEDEAGHLSIEAQAHGQDQVRLTISDDGKGMSPEQQARAFDPFYTTRMGQGGSGLGLHLVYNLVSGVLGGTIELQSSDAGGVAVIVTLPLHAPTTGNEAVPSDE